MALAEAFGVQPFLEGLCGSVVGPAVSEREVESMRGSIKSHINDAWSTEAVRQGVGHAKAGGRAESQPVEEAGYVCHEDDAPTIGNIGLGCSTSIYPHRLLPVFF